MFNRLRVLVRRLGFSFWSLSLGSLAIASVLSGSRPLAAQTSDCVATLDAALTTTIAALPLPPQAVWGVSVVTQDRQYAYQRNGSQGFVPSSNVKLITTAAALLGLGESWQTVTQVYWSRDRLILKGRGDPALSLADLDALAQQTVQNLPATIAIDTLILDDGYFQGDPIDPHWEWEDTQAGYGAPVNATIVDRNAIPITLAPQRVGRSLQVIFERPEDVDRWQVANESVSVADTEPEWVKVGRDSQSNTIRIRGQLIAGTPPEPVSVSIPDPAAYALEAFRQALGDRGLVIPNTAVHHAAFGVGTVVASRVSPALPELVATTNRTSDRLFAEALLRQLGAQAPGAGQDTTRDRGLQQVRDILQRELGLDPDRYTLRDGSGLSRHNSIPPDIFVSLLHGMATSPVAETFIASLPVLGESGTLAAWSPLPNGAIVRAKTGSMSGIYALSGYLVPPGGVVSSPDTLVFSVMVNHSNASYSTTQGAIAALLDPLMQFQQCYRSP